MIVYQAHAMIKDVFIDVVYYDVYHLDMISTAEFNEDGRWYYYRSGANKRVSLYNYDNI